MIVRRSMKEKFTLAALKIVAAIFCEGKRRTGAADRTEYGGLRFLGMRNHQGYRMGKLLQISPTF